MFKKGQFIRYIAGNDRGFAIYKDEIYEVASNSFIDRECNCEIVELVHNGDYESCTFYDVNYFELLD